MQRQMGPDERFMTICAVSPQEAKDSVDKAVKLLEDVYATLEEAADGETQQLMRPDQATNTALLVAAFEKDEKRWAEKEKRLQDELASLRLLLSAASPGASWIHGLHPPFFWLRWPLQPAPSS